MVDRTYQNPKTQLRYQKLIPLFFAAVSAVVTPAQTLEQAWTAAYQK